VKRHSAHLARIGAFVLMTLACCNTSFPLLAQGFLAPYEKSLLERMVNSRIDLGTQDTSLEYLGRWGWGKCQGVATMGNYVFTGSGPTLLWLDVTDKQHPIAVWDTLMLGELKDFTVQDSIGYAITGSSLVLADLRNPRAPAIIAQVNIPVAFSLVVEDSFAFVKRWYGGEVICMDVSDPTSPYLRSAVLSSALWGTLTISNHNLYVGDQGGFTSEHVDVSNPDSMRVTELNLPNFIGAVHARDSLLLVTAGALLDIYSIAVPDSPALLSSTLVPDSDAWITSINLQGDTAYVGTGYGKIVTVSISDRRHPIILGGYSPVMPTPLGAICLAIEDTALYCSYGSALATFSIANPASVPALSFFPTGHESNKVFVRNSLAYITAGMAGLWIVDVSDPTHPRRRGNLHTAGYAYDLIVDSTVAYVSFSFPYCYFNHGEGRTGIWAIDIGRPDSLRVLDTYMTRFPYAIAKSGSLLFVTHSDIVDCGVPDDTTLTILDVSDPSDVRRVGHVLGGYDAGEITSSDSIAFVAATGAGGGLKIYDCRNPANPQLLSTTFSAAFGVSLSGQRAYINAVGRGLFVGDSLFVVDITDLTAPVVLGRTVNQVRIVPQMWESTVAKDVLIWAARGQFGAIDVSDPSQPRVGFEDARALWGGGIYPVDDSLFVTNRYSGLWVFRYDPGVSSVNGEEPMASMIRLFPNYPNPFNASTQLKFVTGAFERVRIEVFNTLGEQVRTVFDSVVDIGEHLVTFDGSGLSSGIYFYRVFSQNAINTGRMVLIK
jgi:hypothetical protein